MSVSSGGGGGGGIGGDLASMIKAKQRNLQKTPAKEPKKPEARDDMQNKIKGGQFALRKMTTSFTPKGMKLDKKMDVIEEIPEEEEEDKTMLTVAAIYEKAKARRLAMEESDDDDDDDFGDDSDDDDW